MIRLPNFKKLVPAALAVLVFSVPQAPVSAQVDHETGFQGFLQMLAARARGEGVSERAIAATIGGLTYNPRVIALDQSQPGSSTGAPPAMSGYLRTHVDAQRINGGRRMRDALPEIAAQVEREYGVPAKMLFAIWGHETNYGSYTGDFDLARSLATLAYEGRRRELFSDEFIALTKMVDRGVPRSRLLGSWAGAFGNPQFLPSVYLRLARDGDGDGDADIWNSRADTLASIANYFRDSGWRTGQPWGVRASVPAEFDAVPVTTRLDSPSCPRVHVRHSAWKTVREWRAFNHSLRSAMRSWPACSNPMGGGNRPTS